MSLYWHYDAPVYSYGSYTAMPSIYASPAFQWGYAQAANQATRIPKRHRRALSLPPEEQQAPLGTTRTQSFTQYGRYGYPTSTRLTSDAIKHRYWNPWDNAYRQYNMSKRMPYDHLYPSATAYSRHIQRKIAAIDDEDDSPIAPPVSFSSLRSRLLVAADMNDASKRLYERYIPGVDDVSLPRYKPREAAFYSKV